MEDGEPESLVLEEPRLGLGEELEPVRARGLVRPRDVALGDVVAKDEKPAGLVGPLGLGVLDERRAHLCRDYHQRRSSIVASAWSVGAVQKSAERYFQPPSARTATTVPSSSSRARRRATWRTAPEETPAKMPSRSRSIRTPATESSFETRIFRSSRSTSRIGGT